MCGTDAYLTCLFQLRVHLHWRPSCEHSSPEGSVAVSDVIDASSDGVGPPAAAGLVACAPIFGGPRSHGRLSRAAFAALLAATDAITVAWLLAQYSFQVRLPLPEAG